MKVRKTFLYDKYFISIFPCVFVMLDDYLYEYKNFALEFHFLTFHLRVLWYDETKKKKGGKQ